MKKIIGRELIALIVAGVLLIQLAGCAADLLRAKFTERDGLLTYTDLQNSPFADTGLKIIIKKGDQGYVKFIKTDLQGQESKDYYLFDYNQNRMEKYYYVSAMGTAFYYDYDLVKGELVKLEGEGHQDVTQSAKDAGRWQSASENIAYEVKVLLDYFPKQYGISIKDAVQAE
jgi:hypothetical protein